MYGLVTMLSFLEKCSSQSGWATVTDDECVSLWVVRYQYWRRRVIACLRSSNAVFCSFVHSNFALFLVNRHRGSQRLEKLLMYLDRYASICGNDISSSRVLGDTASELDTAGKQIAKLDKSHIEENGHAFDYTLLAQ